MNDPLPPTLPLPPGRRRGLGCFAKGCLTTVVVLMLFGVGVGTLGWFLYHSGQAYFTEQQVPTRVADSTDEQYQAVLAKVEPFSQAMNEGRAATLELTAADLNTLVAHSPALAILRGRLFVEIVNSQLVADLSFPFNDTAGPGQYFINAHTTLDASFATGKFTFALRHAQPLQGEAKEGLLPSMLRDPWFLQNYSDKINNDFNAALRDQSRKDPLVAGLLANLRTVVLKDDHLVATTLERPNLPTPTLSPVATPPKTE